MQEELDAELARKLAAESSPRQEAVPRQPEEYYQPPVQEEVPFNPEYADYSVEDENAALEEELMKFYMENS